MIPFEETEAGKRAATIALHAIRVKGWSQAILQADALARNIYHRLPSGDYGRADVRRVVDAALDECAPKRKTPHEFNTALVLSTAHITKATADALEADADTVPWTMRGTYGFMVWAETDEERNGVHPDLDACLDRAAKQGCQWLRLDCDAEARPDLPTYAWEEDKPAFSCACPLCGFACSHPITERPCGRCGRMLSMGQPHETEEGAQ